MEEVFIKNGRRYRPSKEKKKLINEINALYEERSNNGKFYYTARYEGVDFVFQDEGEKYVLEEICDGFYNDEEPNIFSGVLELEAVSLDGYSETFSLEFLHMNVLRRIKDLLEDWYPEEMEDE